MIPKKIRPYLKIEREKRTRGEERIDGRLVCCGNRSFEVFAEGKIRHGIFYGMHLLPENENIALEAGCKECGKRIPVFDSRCDGYDGCDWNAGGEDEMISDGRCGGYEPNGKGARAAFRRVVCNRCGGDAFSVAIRYEYSNDGALEIAEPENAFTWIWVALECRGCGMKYRNFIDFETA